jgi:hypothetical protein
MLDFDFYKRLFVVFVAILQPFIIYGVCGSIGSISSSWETVLQPLFIITNAMVSYFFFDLPKWRIPAVSLLLLTAFPTTEYKTFHDIVAILFFITCLYPIFNLKRFRYYLLLYLFSLIVGLFFGLFWMETWGIITLCIYHLHLMLFTHRFVSR